MIQETKDLDISKFRTVTNTCISENACLSTIVIDGNGLLQTNSREDSKIKKQNNSMYGKVSLQSDEEYINLHNQVFLSGRYNFEGCRIPLKNSLNIDYFRFMLYGYEDEAICDFLEFGFPLGYIGKIQHQNPKSYSFVRNMKT